MTSPIHMNFFNQFLKQFTEKMHFGVKSLKSELFQNSKIDYKISNTLPTYVCIGVSCI